MANRTDEAQQFIQAEFGQKRTVASPVRLGACEYSHLDLGTDAGWRDYAIMRAGLDRRRFCSATATVVPGTLGSPFFFRREYGHE